MTQLINAQLPEYLAKREQARKNDRSVQLVCFVLALFCVGISTLFVAPIDHLRTKHQLTLDPESTKGLPPDIALLTKTGTFRALAIDIAFMRMERLKEDSKFYEINRLSTLLCRMAPRFPSVWKYAAWNLSYNISVANYTPEGRWYWVNKGIHLLRNEGLKYNEDSIGLYLELGYIFWHKVGDFLDDHHWHYKKELAIEIERILGPPVASIDPEDVINAFRPVAEAPASLDTLLERDPEVILFVSRLAEVGLKPDLNLLEFVARDLRTTTQIRDVLAEIEPNIILTQHQQRVQLLTDPDWIEVRDRLLACLRSQQLREDLNMDPAWMLALMEKYGPIDWRNAYMHALYWATRGNMMTRGQLVLDENDSMNVCRYILFGLALTIKRGKMILEPDFDAPENSYLELLPDARFIPYMHQAYLDLGYEQFKDDPRYIPGMTGPNYRDGHHTFLGDAIRQLYIEGGEANLSLAKEYYAYLQKYNRNDDGSPRQDYFLPLKEFVLRDFKENLGSFKTTNMQIGAWLMRSLKWLSLGEEQQATGAYNWAKEFWVYYTKNLTTDVGGLGRQNLPSLKEMYANAVVDFMKQPTGGVHIMHKVRLWKRLGYRYPEIQRMAYDRLSEYFLSICTTNDPPLNPNLAFPPPEGMEEYRENKESPNKTPDNLGHGEKR